MCRLQCMRRAARLTAGGFALLICVYVARADDSAMNRRSKEPFPFFAMNFAMNNERYSSPTTQADLLKELGYDGMAYLGDPAGLTETLKALDAKRLRMFAAYLFPGAEIDIDSDPPGYDPRIKEMIDALKGRETILLICFVASKHSPSVLEGDETAVHIAREIADYAQKAGVRVAIYPHEGYWVQRVEDAVRIAQKADRKNLGICFNLYHWLKTDKSRDPKPIITTALPRLFLVTISGSTPEGSYETLDRGSFDVAPLLRTLREVGYSGPIGLQCVGIEGDPRENLQRSIKAWRDLSARLAGTGGNREIPKQRIRSGANAIQPQSCH